MYFIYTSKNFEACRTFDVIIIADKIDKRLRIKVINVCALMIKAKYLKRR